MTMAGPTTDMDTDHNGSRCLILACGNTLRSDDGFGPWLAHWASERFQSERGVRVLSSQQWTPELAYEISLSESVIFIDCAMNSSPGSLRQIAVVPGKEAPGLGTHHLDASQLLSLAKELYGAVPRRSLLLTIGAGSLELCEGFSEAVQAALPEARAQLETTVLRMLADSGGQRA
jgi:hydrogenase maturation protease